MKNNSSPTGWFSLGIFRSLPPRATLTIVGLLVVAAGIGEVLLRVHLERRYHEALLAQRQLQQQLLEARLDRNRLAEAVLTEGQRAQQLANQLASKDQTLQDTISRLTEEERTIQELQEKLATMQDQLGHAQGELARALQSPSASAPSPAGQPVQLEKVIVAPAATTPANGEGHVLSVHPDWKFVVIDLGWDALNVGDVVSIYRKDQLLGKARVERVQESAAAASLLPEWSQAEIQINDVVRLL